MKFKLSMKATLNNREVLFNHFKYGGIYSVKLLDLMEGDVDKKNNTCDYFFLFAEYLETYSDLGIVKGDIIKTYFSFHSFFLQFDFVLRRDGKKRSDFILDKRYDLILKFIRHSRHRFEILNYSFDPLYNKI